jgi:hypothetical protein
MIFLSKTRLTKSVRSVVILLGVVVVVVGIYCLVSNWSWSSCLFIVQIRIDFLHRPGDNCRRFTHMLMQVKKSIICKTGVKCHSVSISQCFLHCLVNTQKQCKVPQCFHLTVFPSLFGEHSKTDKTRFSVSPYCQVTAYSVNVLLGHSRIWETLKNVTSVKCHRHKG